MPRPQSGREHGRDRHGNGCEFRCRGGPPRPPASGGVAALGRVHVMATHVGTNRGPVTDGWRAGMGARPYKDVSGGNVRCRGRFPHRPGWGWERPKKWGRGGSFPSPKGEEDPVEDCSRVVNDSNPQPPQVPFRYGNRMRLSCQAHRARYGTDSRKKRVVLCAKGGRERRLPSPLPPMVGRRDPRTVLWKSSTRRISEGECQRILWLSTRTRL